MCAGRSNPPLGRCAPSWLPGRLGGVDLSGGLAPAQPAPPVCRGPRPGALGASGPTAKRRAPRRVRLLLLRTPQQTPKLEASTHGALRARSVRSPYTSRITGTTIGRCWVRLRTRPATTSWSWCCRTPISVTRCSAEAARLRSTARRVSSISSSSSPEPKPRRDDLDLAHGRAVGGVDAGDDQQQAVVGEVAPVAQDALGDVAAAGLVDVAEAGVHAVDDGGAVAGHLEHVAVVEHVDALGGDAERPGPARRGRAGGGPRRGSGAKTRGAAAPASAAGRSRCRARRRAPCGFWRSVMKCGVGAHQPVDDLVHGQLVAGHRARRVEDGVAGLDLDLVVLAAGDAAEGGHRLALAAGADQHLLVARAASPAPSG